MTMFFVNLPVPFKGWFKSTIFFDFLKKFFNAVLTLQHQGIPSIWGWYLNGQIEHEVFPDGRERYWYDNGHKKREKSIDGTEYFWHHTGQKLHERRPDGTELKWNRWNVLEEVFSAEDNTQTRYHTEIKHEIAQHFTKGIEDTKVYLAKQRIAEHASEKISSPAEQTTHASNSSAPTKPNGRDDGRR